MPRYRDCKPATMSASDPGPLGSPENFYRWAAGVLIDSRKEKATREVAQNQFAVGISGGAEAMIHACTRDAAENPELDLLSPEIPIVCTLAKTLYFAILCNTLQNMREILSILLRSV